MFRGRGGAIWGKMGRGTGGPADGATWGGLGRKEWKAGREMEVHLLARHVRVLRSASDRRRGTMLLSNADLVIWEAIAKSRGVYVKRFA